MPPPTLAGSVLVKKCNVLAVSPAVTGMLQLLPRHRGTGSWGGSQAFLPPSPLPVPWVFCQPPFNTHTSPLAVPQT